jgi:hypothetical protein
MGAPLWFSTAAFLGVFALLLALRRRLEERRADLETLHLALEE